MFELLISAALGGTLESLASAAVERTPAVTKRIQRAVNLVESQPPTAMQSAIRTAVDAASEDLGQEYVAQIYEGDPDSAVTDLVRLLDHPPFAQEVTAKLLYRGHPDFDRLQQAYLDLPSEQHSRRWDALELPLLDFFDAIERHLLADEAVGDVIRDMQQLARLTRLTEETALIVQSSQAIEQHAAKTAGGVAELAVGIAHQTNTLMEIHRLLVEAQPGTLIGGDAYAGNDLVMRDKHVRGDEVHGDKVHREEHNHFYAAPLDPASQAARVAQERYLTRLYDRCNLLPLASLGGEEQAGDQVTLADVYVDLNTRSRVPLTKEEIEKVGSLGIQGVDIE